MDSDLLKRFVIKSIGSLSHNSDMCQIVSNVCYIQLTKTRQSFHLFMTLIVKQNFFYFIVGRSLPNYDRTKVINAEC